MTEETYLMVSLKEDESKKIAQVMANETCRKILDYLSTVDEASESDIAKVLKIPISTVHYNLKQLIKSKLVESKEFLWSKRGKQMDLYKLAQKFIVIAPRGLSDVKTQLKGLFPVAMISAFAASVIYGVSKYTHRFAPYTFTKAQLPSMADFGAQEVTTKEMAATLPPKGLDFPTKATEEAAEQVIGKASTGLDSLYQTAQEVVNKLSSQLSTCNDQINQIASKAPNYAVWFLVGALFSLLVLFVWNKVRIRKK